MLRSKVKQSGGNPCDQYWRRKEGYGGKDLQERGGFKRGMKEWGVMDGEKQSQTTQNQAD